MLEKDELNIWVIKIYKELSYLKIVMVPELYFAFKLGFQDV